MGMDYLKIAVVRFIISLSVSSPGLFDWCFSVYLLLTRHFQPWVNP